LKDGNDNDGKNIYQSDGTEKIWTTNPENLEMLDYINVYSGKTKIKSINELEYIKGKFYVNVRCNCSKSCKWVSRRNYRPLWSQKNGQNTTAEVLNGIAYNPKNWNYFCNR
jgi:glutamine cyclotransferase